jgi:hypothetical protein
MDTSEPGGTKGRVTGRVGRAPERLRAVVRGWGEATWSAISKAGPERDTALLVGKAALATVLAWQFAVRVLDSDEPFYAPMAALLVVDRTLVRSIGASAQRLAAVVVGMLTAWVVGSLVGVHWWSMLPVIFLALFIARWRRLGDHGIQVPTMALLSLLTVGGTNAEFTYLTIAETLAGGLIGVVTNAVVLPPLHIREPREQIMSLTDQVRGLLADISHGLRTGWDADTAGAWYDASIDVIERAPLVHDHIDTGRESTQLNPRESMLGIVVDWGGYAETVEALRRSQWQVSGIARTLRDAADEKDRLPAPSQGFLDAYADALDHVGAALDHFGLDDDHERDAVRNELREASTILDRLSHEVRETRLDDPHAWPAHGALLLDARRLALELHDRTDRAIVPTDSGVIPRPTDG